jgi:electron transfer flavoprotein beta subunit
MTKRSVHLKLPEGFGVKVIVCVKQVLDVSAPLKIDEAINKIHQDRPVFVLNPADECALEEAVRLRESLGEVEITAITLGPARAEAALRQCLAMGADQAIHLQDRAFEGSDSYATAVALSLAIKKTDYDLILCGSQSLDGGSAQVPAILAELLHLPQVLAITQLDVSPHSRKVTVHRKLPRGNREIVECLLPAVFSLEDGVNKPRYPSLRARMKALQKGVRVLNLGSLGLTKDEVGPQGSLTKCMRVALPRPRPKKIQTAEVSSAAERMRFLMSGGITQEKGGKLLEGDTDKLVTEVIRFLRDKRILGDWGCSPTKQEGN